MYILNFNFLAQFRGEIGEEQHLFKVKKRVQSDCSLRVDRFYLVREFLYFGQFHFLKRHISRSGNESTYQISTPYINLEERYNWNKV